MSAARDDDFIHITELFAGFGPVSVRRMFSGAGIFSGGVMIGLVSRGVIYLKADAGTIPSFEREGLGPFRYTTSRGSRSLMSYWKMPDRLYDDPDELARWASQAHAAALASARPASPQPKSRKTKVRKKAKAKKAKARARSTTRRKTGKASPRKRARRG